MASIMTNDEFWQQKKGQYPFHVETDKSVRVILDPEKYSHYIRVPFSDHVKWGFKTEVGRILFQADYVPREVNK